MSPLDLRLSRQLRGEPTRRRPGRALQSDGEQVRPPRATSLCAELRLHPRRHAGAGCDRARRVSALRPVPASTPASYSLSTRPPRRHKRVQPSSRRHASFSPAQLERARAAEASSSAFRIATRRRAPRATADDSSASRMGPPVAGSRARTPVRQILSRPRLGGDVQYSPISRAGPARHCRADPTTSCERFIVIPRSSTAASRHPGDPPRRRRSRTSAASSCAARRSRRCSPR